MPQQPGVFAPHGEDPNLADDDATYDPEHREKMHTMLDVLNSEGQFIMSKPRYIVHREGFWHRALNVWVIDLSTGRVLIGQRAAGKDIDPCKWTCVSGRVPSGELSMNAALSQLENEFSIKPAQASGSAVASTSSSALRDISLMFSIKCSRDIDNGVFTGQRDATWLDIYAACLNEEIPVERLKLDLRDKQSARYIRLEQLRRAYARRDPEFVIPPNEEYITKLFKYLTKLYKNFQQPVGGVPTPHSTLSRVGLKNTPC